METKNRTAFGFTLIELLITVAIVAILASIAYPSYQDSVRRSHRTEAAGKVLEMAQRLEKIRAQTYSYGGGNNLSDERQRYIISSVVVNSEDDGETYTITATPRDNTDQVNDMCGTFSYNNRGEWTFGNSLTYQDCL